MSEAEKKKRAGYRHNRKKWISIQSIAIVVLTLAVLISSIVAVQLNRTYYVNYREDGHIDYKVFLKENDFYDEPYLDDSQSYVASLIDQIIADFNYEIAMDAQNVNYRYSYNIDARLEIIDNTSEVPIFNPSYTLKSSGNLTQNSNSKLKIDEIVVLDYDEYNDLANLFIETYGLDKVTSNIVVTMTVDVLSECSAFGDSAMDRYMSELRIPLTTKTVNVEMTSAVPTGGEKMIACARGAGSEVFKTTAIVFAVIDVLLALVLVAFIYLTRTEDSTYIARVKKITSHYKSYIQKINNMFDMTNFQVIMVDSFDEMLEIRDTIQAPILMHENADKTCTKFIIPTDSKLLYIYEIKVEGYVEPTPEPKPEPTPTTIVKPNITNVVRPVVKVVVTPPAPPAPAPVPDPEPEAEIETVVEEAEIEIEAAPEQEPIVEAVVEEVVEEEIPEEIEEPVEEIVEEEIPEEIEEPVEEIVEEEVEEVVEEAIPETVEEPVEETVPEVVEEIVEEPGIDVIDVRWPEARSEDKVYRYDPDGETVGEGDVVLVPTRDEASNKDIVREAEVARGNYKMNPDELDRPLKKIIGVVKRKMEKAFVAMITPEDTDNESEAEDNSI